MKLIEETKERNPDEALEKELHDIRGKVVELEKDNFKKQKDIEFLARENKSLAGELGLKAGMFGLDSIHVRRRCVRCHKRSPFLAPPRPLL